MILAGVIVAFGSILYWQQRVSILQSCQEELRTNVAVLVSKLNSVSPRMLADYLVEKVGREQLPAEAMRIAKMGPGGRRGPGPGPGGLGQDPPPTHSAGESERDPANRPGGRGNWWDMFDRPSHEEFVSRKNAELNQALTLPTSPYDELRRRKAKDKAYFCIWVGDGVPVKSTVSPNVLPHVSPTVTFPSELNAMDSSTDPEDLPVSFRQNGIRLEAYARADLGTSVLVGRDIGLELGHLHRTGWWIVGSGLLTWVLGLGGGWFLSRGSTHPIKAITRVAAEISESQLNGRIPTDQMDIEFAELSETLNKTFSRLEAAIERQRQFTADASHELRTPLAILQMQQQLALSKTRTPQEYQKTLKTCDRAVNRMNQLVESLLLLARVDSNRLQSEREPIDLGAIAEQELETFELLAREKKVKLSGQIHSLIVDGHEAQIRSVINNLLANAINYTNAGGSVSIQLERATDFAILSVKDTGEGIPQEELEKVFDRFYRVHQERSRETGGLGIGLSLCKAIIEQHEGEISVTSEVGVGSQFTFTLPLTAV